MGFALSRGIRYEEIDNMSLDEFDLAVQCIQAYDNLGKEKTMKRIQNLSDIPTDENGFDFFCD